MMPNSPSEDNFGESESNMKFGTLENEPGKMLDTAKSEIDTVGAASPNTPDSEVVPELRTLEELIQQEIPEEIRVMILKELLRLWATKIPRRAFRWNLEDLSQRKGFYKATNRAILAHIESPAFVPYRPTTTRRRRRRGIVTPELQDGELPEINLGWCAIPDGPGLDYEYATVWRHNTYSDLVGLYFWLSTEYLGLSPSKIAWHQDKIAQHPIKIENILQLTSCSAAWKKRMHAFFFGHMIWQFRSAYHFSVTISKAQALNDTDILEHIEHISLPLSSWDRFVSLFHSVLDSFKVGKSLVNLKTLEINGFGFTAKRARHRVVNDSVRTRYLVTACYKLLKYRPKLTICLAGTSECSHPDTNIRAPKETAEDAEDEKAKNIERWGLGFTADEVSQFKKGTFAVMPKAQSLNFGELSENTDGKIVNFYLVELGETHWKMKFAQEWKKIWAQGTLVSERDGGYAVVTNPCLTYCCA